MSTSTETRFFPGDLVSNIYVYDGTVMVVLRVDPNGTDRWKCVYVFNPVTEKEERYFVPQTVTSENSGWITVMEGHVS